MAEVLVLANEYTTILHFRMELLKSLIMEGHDVTIGLPDDPKNEEFLTLGCKVESVRLERFGTNPFKDLGLLWQYLLLLRRIKPDIVLTYTAKPNIYGGIACQIMRVPYICNVTGLGGRFQRDGLIKLLMMFLQRVAYRKSSMVFFQNSANMAYMKSHHIVSGNAGVLPGSGVNLEANALSPYPPQSEVIRFITVSRMRQDKGLDELFIAICQAEKAGYNLELHLAGWYEDDEYKDKISRIANECPVVYHGAVSQEEVRQLISQCHCLIHPSHHEGMANVILEAAAIGRPCLASDIPGCREAVEDGVNGLLFKVKDATSLFEAIQRFISLPYAQMSEMGLRGRRKMEAEFNRQLVVDRYLAAINIALETT